MSSARSNRKRPAATAVAGAIEEKGISQQTAAPSSVGVQRRRTVELATDADAVLAKCRMLKATLIAKKLKEQEEKDAVRLNDDDDHDSMKSDDSKQNKKKSSIPKGIVEVDDLSATEVLEGIEGIALEITEQILRKKGFSMEIPSRAASNQIYVPEWDRIVLGNKRTERTFLNVRESRKSAITLRVMQLLHAVLVKRIHITKRDLFYTDVKLFVDQAESDGVLDDVATMIGCTRSNLHVVASDKGLVVGRIQFEEDGDPIDCTRMGVGGKAIPPYIDKIENIRSDAEFILLVEKEAAYMRMAEDRFYHKYPCIVITAKGQPDVATRMFLARITNELQIPVLGLVDSDPYGLKILSVYMSGSKNMSYDSAKLTTPDIMWLGLRPSDLNKYDLPEQCRLDMTENDIKTGKELMTEDFIKKNPKWMKELEIMVKTKKKAEIQALSSFGFQYITEEYLPRKLKEGDWI
ncbi:DNA topoisomerase VI subunit A [Nitzschia inconspicua]|uniref:DNA topoisomerase (ATP-hydrolyzing) n=1 Tax=Nitzschia inconspicua TaxID=303405 RepID=A0A9K3KCM3_9STRA|nr:DNA topoisomerase VI subunit A [Nitzschia inconspicua]